MRKGEEALGSKSLMEPIGKIEREESRPLEREMEPRLKSKYFTEETPTLCQEIEIGFIHAFSKCIKQWKVFQDNLYIQNL